MNITELIDDMNYYGKLDEKELLEEISKIDNSEDLHRIILKYNWDDGFEIPQIILDNENCELSTALTIFDLAEGKDYLTEKDESAYDEEWFDFVSRLYERIIEGKFKKGNIRFKPQLAKTQIYKLKKVLSENEFVFIEETGVKNIE